MLTYDLREISYDVFTRQEITSILLVSIYPSRAFDGPQSRVKRSQRCLLWSILRDSVIGKLVMCSDV